jgi:hypothetical protein
MAKKTAPISTEPKLLKEPAKPHDPSTDPLPERTYQETTLGDNLLYLSESEMGRLSAETKQLLIEALNTHEIGIECLGESSYSSPSITFRKVETKEVLNPWYTGALKERERRIAKYQKALSLYKEKLAAWEAQAPLRKKLEKEKKEKAEAAAKAERQRKYEKSKKDYLALKKEFEQ